MKLTLIDWSIVAAYFLFNLAIGFYYKARAGANMNEFFSGGAISLVAGRDVDGGDDLRRRQPLAVTGMVARNGIAGNWLWWNFCRERHADGVSIRASLAALGSDDGRRIRRVALPGPARGISAGFRALYLGIPINCIILVGEPSHGQILVLILG